jgi:hypothetical protein
VKDVTFFISRATFYWQKALTFARSKSLYTLFNKINIMNLFEDLSVQENESFLRFPAYISMLAANCDSRLDEEEKNSVIKLVHTKTFTCDPLLIEFYKEADKVFKNNIEQIDKYLPNDKNHREAVIKKELMKLEKIISKLGKNYSLIMHHSMKSFKEHVSKAHHNVLIYFVFPLPIPGLTEI